MHPLHTLPSAHLLPRVPRCRFVSDFFPLLRGMYAHPPALSVKKCNILSMYAQHLQKTTKSLTPKMYDDIRSVWRCTFGSHSGWAQAILFAGELTRCRQHPSFTVFL